MWKFRKCVIPSTYWRKTKEGGNTLTFPQETIVLEIVENLQEIIWAKIALGVRDFIKKFIENLLREELPAKIGARRYERTKTRRGYRNGYYMRDFLRFGAIEKIRVPRMGPGPQNIVSLTHVSSAKSAPGCRQS
ncbi:MAG: transposase [Candidatus Hodarchaeota archaeon]